MDKPKGYDKWSKDKQWGFLRGLAVGRLEVSLDIMKQIRAIPHQNFLHADRYDDDHHLILHIWNDKGISYDVRVKKPFSPTPSHLTKT